MFDRVTIPSHSQFISLEAAVLLFVAAIMSALAVVAWFVPVALDVDS